MGHNEPYWTLSGNAQHVGILSHMLREVLLDHFLKERLLEEGIDIPLLSCQLDKRKLSKSTACQVEQCVIIVE